MSDRTDILMPSDQAEGTTNVVGKWFKAVGDTVRINDPLLEITTDKVTVEVAAAADGVLVEILKQEGENVEPGEVLGRIGSGAGAAAAPATSAPAPAATAPSARADAGTGAETELSPAVRRLLKEHHLQASQIKGSGRGGRITVQDIEAHLAGGAQASTPAQATAGIPSRVVPHTQMRKSIAHHMAQSVATAPHVTSVFECDLSRVLAHREANRGALEAQGIKLTLTAYFVRAAVAALQAVPEVNSRWHDDGLELYQDCNIGIGTALEQGGLIVPVIHRAQELDLAGLARRLTELTERARTGSLEPKEVQQGTFTISNHGVSGSLVAAPIIINQPQSAILGVGKLEKRAVVVSQGGKDEIVIKPMIYVTLTIDHRVLDGFQANAFLTKWVATIEQWS